MSVVCVDMGSLEFVDGMPALRPGLLLEEYSFWMSFKKPFRASPVRLGPYHRAQQRRQQSIVAAKVLSVAVAGGLAVGLLAAVNANGGLTVIGSAGREAAVFSGLARRNTPMPGAHYSGCNEARAAGVAPLYVGEPGYRSGMDGDGDGVACEPYRT
ncbi:MAG TPA: excalibur calcium-binding domain-containing protein [Sphingomonadaceae bacterium]|jgi:hypothetical protein|nr:excalibur calcium-binding domain-containing protein [Sphingomonadaceae bacterium]